MARAVVLMLPNPSFRPTRLVMMHGAPLDQVHQVRQQIQQARERLAGPARAARQIDDELGFTHADHTAR